MTSTIDNYFQGEDMTDHGSHTGHGAANNDDFEAEERKPFEVPEEEQKLYKNIIKNVFKPKWHKDAHRKHHKAHRIAMQTLQEKVEEYERGTEYLSREQGKQALAYALIEYRKEAGIPFSEDSNDFHRVYAEVDQLVENMKDQGGNPLNIEKIINEGNIEQLLLRLHMNETEKTIKGKLKYELDMRIKSNKQPEYYHNLFKAYANEVGLEIDETEIKKRGRDELIHELMGHYDNKMKTVMEKYTAHKAKAYHTKHPEAANNNEHLRQRAA